MSLFEHAIHIFKEIAVHVAGHVISHKATKHGESGHLSPAENQYLAVRAQLAGLPEEQTGNLAIQEQRLALEKQALAVQTELSRNYLANLRNAQQEDVKARVEKIQADYDNQHWAGVLSRQETLSLLSQTAASQARLLMVVSQPDVSESCPAVFRHDLGREVRGKLKGFVEKHYPAHSDYAVEFFGKFFKSEVFDTEIKQLENVLAPLHLATIVSDVTRNEVMFHLRLCFGAEAPVFSLTTEFPWKEEQDRLMAEGMDAEKSLDAVQKAIVGE